MTDSKKMRNAWENEDGSTNVDGFLKEFYTNDNVFWFMEQGHALNVIDELIDRIEAKDAKIVDLMGKFSDKETLMEMDKKLFNEQRKLFRTQLDAKDAQIKVLKEALEEIPHICITHHHLVCGGCVAKSALDKVKLGDFPVFAEQDEPDADI